jgi:ribosomal protein S18
MKKILLLAFTLLTLTACQESLEDRCVREAKEYTHKNCPAPAGENIIIDSMSFEKATHTLCYYYSLTGKIDDKTIIDKASPKMQQQLLFAIKTATNMKTYKDDGYSFKYTYYSSKEKNKILYVHTFTKNDYK